MSSYVRRAYSSFAAHIFDIPPRLLAFLCILVLFLIPTAGLNRTSLAILVDANVLAIFAVSWDLLVGRTGQISLGHALFSGVGGYTSALLFKFLGLPLWISIPGAMATGVLVGVIIGLPCLRVKGPYLALVTLAFPLIVQNVVKWGRLNSIFGSELGITDVPTFFPFLQRLARVQAEYYLTLTLLLISAVIIYKIANSKTGIVFVSILDDEVGSKACGINVTKYKLMAFMISGFFASLAGCINVHLFPTGATHLMFALPKSLTPLIVTFLGGIGTIYGAIVGSYIYLILDRYVMDVLLPIIMKQFNISVSSDVLNSTKLIIFTLIVLIIVIKWPRGIATFTTDKLDDLEEARDLDERGPRIWKRYKKK
ncbi:hypothetical protein GTO27_12870 [Candidatus Bathyarchaeota archaeon]|nr:hypothetical protein [Candidatus Bathyarchaeota archaeon]